MGNQVLENEVYRQRRKDNWQAISNMGKTYKTAYLIIAAIAILLFIIGIIAGVSELIIASLAIMFIVNGGMTIFARARGFVKREYDK